MVAYSFKTQFVEPIRSGTKRQTIRAPRLGRSRHARPGDDLQLYTGMRTKFCTIIRRAICISTAKLELELNASRAVIHESSGGLTTIWPSGMDEFAACDGFEDWPQMRAFWEKYHPNVPVFVGVLIRWRHFRG